MVGEEKKRCSGQAEKRALSAWGQLAKLSSAPEIGESRSFVQRYTPTLVCWTNAVDVSNNDLLKRRRSRFWKGRRNQMFSHF